MSMVLSQSLTRIGLGLTLLRAYFFSLLHFFKFIILVTRPPKPIDLAGILQWGTKGLCPLPRKKMNFFAWNCIFWWILGGIFENLGGDNLHSVPTPNSGDPPPVIYTLALLGNLLVAYLFTTEYASASQHGCRAAPRDAVCIRVPRQDDGNQIRIVSGIYIAHIVVLSPMHSCRHKM